MGKLPTEEDIAWMMAHINDSTVPDIIVCCVICSIASVIILALRIWARFQAGLKPIFSDWLVVGSVLNICNPILYGVSSVLVKWSILALYLAIFPQRKFHYWVHFVSTVNLLNGLAIILVSCLQCRPLEALWNTSVVGTCINFSYFSIFNSVFNFLLDVVILLTPLPLVKQLNSSTRKKILLSINFALGGSACIIAAIRVPYARRVGGTVNPSWDMIPGGLLCVVEVAVALLTASLPIYRPLLRFLGVRITSDSASNYKRGNLRSSSNFLGSQVSTHITSGRDMSSQQAGISITDDITLTTHTYVGGEWVRVADEDDDAAGLVVPDESAPYARTVSSTMSDKFY
ncbi:uncharacterized protein BDZ83DRAFT_594860 [Colletotrichum acutatum]|uniref:Rhodopsin domain-containing protein n=1 Tax=Glomerella acutata TaxID=27357 RepID=A0AAD8U935_GLOAC|nr:uncharacterized protein BDZ83DRAFT_594860 [Colletotrichum acutatum]KAK1704665.1 hypothetical protein BDZ83DRAFT_594860 [Colletotrichum acutatum]